MVAANVKTLMMNNSEVRQPNETQIFGERLSREYNSPLKILNGINGIHALHW